MIEDLRTHLQIQRWAMWAGVAIVLTAILVYVEIVPRAQETYGLWATWSARQEQLERSAGWQSELEQLETEQKRLQKQFESQLTPLVTNGRMSTTLDVLQMAARDNEVMIREVRPGPLNEKATHAEQSVVLRLEGTFRGHVGFVYAVETSQHLINIERLRIYALRHGGEALAAEITARIFSAGDGGKAHVSSEAMSSP